MMGGDVTQLIIASNALAERTGETRSSVLEPNDHRLIGVHHAQDRV